VKKSAALCAFSLCAWILASAAFAAGELKGKWTIEPADEAGQVHFGMFRRFNGGNMNHESDWPVSAFQGLDLATRARHDVKFAIARDAGRFDCEGFLENGEGVGTFLFTPDAKFVPAMDALGFDDIDADKQFAMAIHDVSIDYARQMKARNLRGLDTDKLLAFRIFDITQQFIEELRKEGLQAEDADRLVAFRVHGVTPQLVRELKRAQIDVGEDQLIAFRVHGVTPEFVNEVESLGYPRVDPDQLIAMRVHGVTPKFISEMKARGLKDLSIDKLVALRVHGMD
jgi:hypothetical protein